MKCSECGDKFTRTDPCFSCSYRVQPGDRVTRQKYLDDGTWARKGDKCLAKSPLLHGTVIRVYIEPRTQFNRTARKLLPMCEVRWDETGESQSYFFHGVDRA